MWLSHSSTKTSVVSDFAVVWPKNDEPKFNSGNLYTVSKIQQAGTLAWLEWPPFCRVCHSQVWVGSRLGSPTRSGHWSWCWDETMCFQQWILGQNETATGTVWLFSILWPHSLSLRSCTANPLENSFAAAIRRWVETIALTQWCLSYVFAEYVKQIWAAKNMSLFPFELDGSSKKEWFFS